MSANYFLIESFGQSGSLSVAQSKLLVILPHPSVGVLRTDPSPGGKPARMTRSDGDLGEVETNVILAAASNHSPGNPFPQYCGTQDDILFYDF